MALAITVDKSSGLPDTTQAEEIVQGTIVFSGTYPAGGDTLSFAGTNKIQSRLPPNRVEIYEEPTGSQVMSGDTFAFVKGTTQANGKLQISTATAAPLPTAAYPAVFLTPTTTVKFRAWFPLGQ